MKPSRRQFLIWSGVGLTALLNKLPPKSKAQGNSADVLVIGAGMAGLAAARRLQADDYSVIVLEARERIGGRIFTDYSLADEPIELGAEFIHGENVRTWEDLRRYGLNAVPDREGDFLVFMDGEVYRDEDAIDELYSALDEIYEAADEWVDNEEDDAPVTELLPNELSASERRIINQVLGPDYGTDIANLGIYGIVELTYEGDGETDFRVREGYSALINAIAQGLDIRLNSPVQHVDWSDGVSVRTADNQVYEADYVVITLPLGVLQAGDVQFEPRLPAEKREAIATLGVGKVHKVILKFRDNPFPPSVTSLVTEGTSQFWWRAGVSETRNIWTALVSGQAAEAHTTMSDAEIIEAALDDIAKALEENRDTLEASLLEGRIMRWSTEPYSKMGYSYVPVDGTEYREVLAESLEDTLFFAGEASHPIRAATVHGALETGLRAAGEIIELG